MGTRFYAFGGILGQASGRVGLEKQYLVMYPLFLGFLVEKTDRGLDVWE